MQPLFNTPEENNNEPAQQTSTYTPTPTTTDPEVIKWKLTYKDIAQEYIFHLRGLELTEQQDGSIQVIRITEPKLTEDGIKAVYSFLTSKINKASSTTNLTIDEIKAIMGTSHRALARLFLVNHKKWGVTLAQATEIINEILDLEYFILKKSYEDRERRYMSQTETTVITQNPQPQTRKWSLFRR